MAHGADARPLYIDGAYQSSDGGIQPTADQLFYYSKTKLLKVAVIEEHSSVEITKKVYETYKNNFIRMFWFVNN